MPKFLQKGKIFENVYHERLTQEKKIQLLNTLQKLQQIHQTFATKGVSTLLDVDLGSLRSKEHQQTEKASPVAGDQKEPEAAKTMQKPKKVTIIDCTLKMTMEKAQGIKLQKRAFPFHNVQWLQQPVTVSQYPKKASPAFKGGSSALRDAMTKPDNFSPASQIPNPQMNLMDYFNQQDWDTVKTHSRHSKNNHLLSKFKELNQKGVHFKQPTFGAVNQSNTKRMSFFARSPSMAFEHHPGTFHKPMDRHRLNDTVLTSKQYTSKFTTSTQPDHPDTELVDQEEIKKHKS